MRVDLTDLGNEKGRRGDVALGITVKENISVDS